MRSHYVVSAVLVTIFANAALADNKQQLQAAADGLIVDIHKAEVHLNSPIPTLKQKAQEYKATLSVLVASCKSSFTELPCNRAIVASRKAQKAYELAIPMCADKSVDDKIALLRESNKLAEEAYKSAMSSLDANMTIKYKQLQSDKNVAIKKALESDCSKPGVQRTACCKAISDAQTKIDDYAKGLRTFGKPPAKAPPVFKPVPAPRKN